MSAQHNFKLKLREKKIINTDKSRQLQSLKSHIDLHHDKVTDEKKHRFLLVFSNMTQNDFIKTLPHLKTIMPLVCLFKPSVCIYTTCIEPLVVKKIPFVCNIKENAFTLVELIITLTILGITAAIAIPSMNTFVESNRLTALTNDFLADINLARSESIKRGVQTAICGSPTSPSCAGGANWNGGWLVFVDADNSSTWSSGDIEIKTHEAVPKNNTITPPATIIVFNRSGGSQSGNVTSTVCNSNIKKKRDIGINSVGRTSLTEGSC